jgi:hypothetical protein
MAVKPVFHISFRQEHHKNRQNLAGTYSEGYFHRTERSPPFSPSSPPPFKLSLVPKDLFPSCPAPSFILFPILHGGSPHKIPIFPKPPWTLYFRRSSRPPESEPPPLRRASPAHTPILLPNERFNGKSPDRSESAIFSLSHRLSHTGSPLSIALHPCFFLLPGGWIPGMI